MSDIALEFLLFILNRIFLQHSFPEQWSRAILLSFLKANKYPKSVDSYHRIALTSCLCKLLEKIINLRLTYYLEQNILSPSHIGFRKISTVDAIAKLETHILQAYANKTHLVAVFFYIEKPYDTTWKYRILENIYEHGIRGPIENFIHDRAFKVRIADELSTVFPQEQCVPQGSVLSVTVQYCYE